MRTYVRTWTQRIWAVEGSNGAGRSVAQRLLADGEYVVDVPAKLSARVRLFDTGHNRKTDAHDAHAVAVVAVRTRTPRVLASPPAIHSTTTALLAELTTGKVKKDITALPAKAILSGVRPRDVVGKTRNMLALEQLAEMVALDAKIKASTKELKTLVLRSGIHPDGPDQGRAGGRRPDPGRRR